ncbi:nuclear transport factor 2 family protein [Paraflavitalea pollutisoli]|uniref:nuclear transport factor 2 family protein n=1 Tax=Paraflavitalea pollutisoli TaxID=3034143 RepID=UPI0023EDB4C9|nr:nuclear transport factor 2 family protein [Paraflavitalea sp. H1-2-19X]
MDNKQILNGFLGAFDRNDTEAILSYVTDDMHWDMIGDMTIDGKDALRKFFTDNADMKLVRSTRTHFILQGEEAAITGEVLCRNDKTGKEYHMDYCDVYQMENGKIKKMVTYNIDKKK